MRASPTLESFRAAMRAAFPGLKLLSEDRDYYNMIRFRIDGPDGKALTPNFSVPARDVRADLDHILDIVRMRLRSRGVVV